MRQSAERQTALRRAATAFEQVHQVSRVRRLKNRLDLLGVYADVWTARTFEELQDQQTAQDVYDEVIASGPEAGETRTGYPVDAAVPPSSGQPLSTPGTP